MNLLSDVRNERYTLYEIVKYQADFDERHGWLWKINNEEDFINALQYLSIALSGEVGEFCNLVKKLVREFRSSGKIKPDMINKLKEELVDVFIYVIKGASQLFNMDIGEEYFKKMSINEVKFRRYEKND